MEQSSPKELANEAFLKGLTAIQVGKLKEAIDYLSDAIRNDPNSAQSWLRLTQALEQLGDKDGAANAYRRALESCPESPELWYQAGEFQRWYGDRNKAELYLSRATELSPGSIEILDAYVDVLCGAENWEGVKAPLSTLSRLLPASAPPITINKTINRLKRFPELIAEEERLRRYMVVDRKDIDNLPAFSKLLCDSGRQVEMEEIIRQILRDSPFEGRFYLHLLHLLWQSGNVTEARSHVLTVLSNHSNKQLQYTRLHSDGWSEFAEICQQFGFSDEYKIARDKHVKALEDEQFERENPR